MFWRSARFVRRQTSLKRIKTDLLRLVPQNVFATDVRCDCRSDRLHCKLACLINGTRYVLCPYVLFIQLERIWLNFRVEPQLTFEELMERSKCDGD